MDKPELFGTEGQRLYYAQRQTPEWARMREAVFNRDGYKCRICGCRNDLEPHHIRYTDILNPGNVVTLCRKCHQIITDAVHAAAELKVSVSVDITRPDLIGYEITAARGQFVAETLFELWKRTLLDDCEWRNFRNLDTVHGVADEILIPTLTAQACRPGDNWDCTYVMKLHPLINGYLAEAYRHYKAEGWPDDDIARFLHLEYAKIAKVKEHAARLANGCEPSG